MIIEEIEGNIGNLCEDEKEKHVEKVYVEKWDLVKGIEGVKRDE